MLTVKALHIIFIVTWFSGLFYIVRLFVYYAEAAEKQEPERSILQNQYKLMQKRLWFGITWPSAVLTLIFGSTLIYLYGSVPDWLWVKLGFVVLLYAYHFSCHAIFRQQQQGIVKYNGNQLRMWNEVSSLLLVSIVLLVVLKNLQNWIWGLTIIVLLGLSLFLAIKVYRRIREKKS